MLRKEHAAVSGAHSISPVEGGFSIAQTTIELPLGFNEKVTPQLDREGNPVLDEEGSPTILHTSEFVDPMKDLLHNKFGELVRLFTGQFKDEEEKRRYGHLPKLADDVEKGKRSGVVHAHLGKVIITVGVGTALAVAVGVEVARDGKDLKEFVGWIKQIANKDQENKGS